MLPSFPVISASWGWYCKTKVVVQKWESAQKQALACQIDRQIRTLLDISDEEGESILNCVNPPFVQDNPRIVQIHVLFIMRTLSILWQSITDHRLEGPDGFLSAAPCVLCTENGLDLRSYTDHGVARLAHTILNFTCRIIWIASSAVVT